MHNIGYKLRANLRSGIEEEIQIFAQIEEGEDIPQELEKLRALAFSASHSEDFLVELRERRRKAEYDLQKAVQALEVAQKDWEKAKEFLEAQGLSKSLPEFPASAVPTVIAPGKALVFHEF